MDPLILVLLVCAVFIGAFILVAAIYALGNALGCTTGDPPLVPLVLPRPITPHPSIHYKPINTKTRINYMPQYNPVTVDRVQWKQQYENNDAGQAQFEAEVFSTVSPTTLPIAKVVYTIHGYSPETSTERVAVHIATVNPYCINKMYNIKHERFPTPKSAMRWLDQQLANISYRVNDTTIADSIHLMKIKPHTMVEKKLYTSGTRPHSTAVPSDPKEPHIHIHSHGPNWRHSHGHNHIDADHWHGHAGVV